MHKSRAKNTFNNYVIVADNPVGPSPLLAGLKNPTTSSVEIPISFHEAYAAKNAHEAPTQLAKYPFPVVEKGPAKVTRQDRINHRKANNARALNFALANACKFRYVKRNFIRENSTG